MTRASETVHQLRTADSTAVKFKRWFRQVWDEELDERLVVQFVCVLIVLIGGAAVYFFFWRMPEVPQLSEYANARYAAQFKQRGLSTVSFCCSAVVFIDTVDVNGTTDLCEGMCPSIASPLSGGPFDRFDVSQDETGRLHVNANVVPAKGSFIEGRDRFDRAMAMALERYDQRSKVLESWKTPPADSTSLTNSTGASPAVPASGGAASAPSRP